MLKLLSSSCRQGRLRIPCSRFPDDAVNGALEKSPLFRAIRSLRSSAGERTLFRQTALFSSESGEGDGDAAKSVDAKAAEEAEYASTGAEAEEAKASSAIVPTIPRPEDHLNVMVVPLPHRPLFPGFYMPVSIKDSKLLSALADNCKRSVTYAGAFLFKDEPGTDPSLVSGTETGKSIYEFKGQELFNRLHDIGTLAQISSIQGNEVYLLGHRRLRKTEMVDEEPLTVKVDHLKELPYNKDDDVIKATYFEVISTLRDVLKISSVWREYAKTYSRYIGEFTYGRLADFGAALSMANKLLCQQVLEELDVLFVCTANVIETIPTPLLDRMEVIAIAGYITDEKMHIARDYLEKATREACGIKPEQVEVTAAALLELIENYCQEAGVRNLQKQIEKIYRKVDKVIDIGEKAGGDAEVDKVVIDVSNLVDFVGKPVFHAHKIYDQTPIGVAMGLAWTLVEQGEGKGALHFTGQLGDAMKESAQIAHTVARAILLEKVPENSFFANSKLHLHVPAGATPKDGPSAGCTMITSLLYLAIKRPVRKDLAMTGEVTLTGRILPIGGVKEKTIAARSEVKTIIFPAANRRDFDELSDNVKEGLDVHFVDDYSQIFELAFGNIDSSES